MWDGDAEGQSAKPAPLRVCFNQISFNQQHATACRLCDHLCALSDVWRVSTISTTGGRPIHNPRASTPPPSRYSLSGIPWVPPCAYLDALKSKTGLIGIERAHERRAGRARNETPATTTKPPQASTGTAPRRPHSDPTLSPAVCGAQNRPTEDQGGTARMSENAASSCTAPCFVAAAPSFAPSEDTTPAGATLPLALLA